MNSIFDFPYEAFLIADFVQVVGFVLDTKLIIRFALLLPFIFPLLLNL